MTFLVSAGSSETFEDAISQLRTLVEKVQVSVQKKPEVAADTKEDMWTNAGGPLLEVDDTFASWETRAMQRMDGPSRKSHVFHERSRYPDVLETDETKDTEFERIQRHKRHTAKKDIGRLQASYLQPRDQWPNYVGTHRRVQRYPKATRWTPRYYTSDPIRTEAGYLIHEHGENEESQENARNIRQRSSTYQEPLQRFAKVSHNLYEYDKPRHENDATFSAYSETVDVTNENARPNGAPEVLGQYHQFMHRPQTSRRTFKRPLGKMQRDVTSPPTIYGHRVPYSCNYMFDDDNNDWMTEDEEMDGDYGYPPHFGPVEVPVVRRSRHFESTNAQQWSGPAGRGLQQMYKRRRRSQEDLSLNNEMTDDITFETRNHEHVSSPSPNIRTVVVGPLDNVTDNANGVGAFPDHTDTFAGNRAEEGSTPSSSSSSVVHTDSADLEFGQNHVTNAVPSQLAVDELVASNVNKDAESSTRETLSEEEDESANEEDLQLTSDNATAKEHPIEHTLQTEVVPLDSDASIREATAFLSPRRSAAPTNFPTRDTPESCVASSVSSVVKDTDHNIAGVR
ncbi:unnamed protein product [Peronospora destructor]|uniref:Uncharacterized protein n=1 Tax=Peronospora destructor TaxID=86335 RepID=A0AAV0TBF5_9STRA|nr:unnamed protein product [Peronospora destructor]